MSTVRRSRFAVASEPGAAVAAADARVRIWIDVGTLREALLREILSRRCRKRTWRSSSGSTHRARRICLRLRPRWIRPSATFWTRISRSLAANVAGRRAGVSGARGSGRAVRDAAGQLGGMARSAGALSRCRRPRGGVRADAGAGGRKRRRDRVRAGASLELSRRSRDIYADLRRSLRSPRNRGPAGLGGVAEDVEVGRSAREAFNRGGPRFSHSRQEALEGAARKEQRFGQRRSRSRRLRGPECRDDRLGTVTQTGRGPQHSASVARRESHVEPA